MGAFFSLGFLGRGGRSTYQKFEGEYLFDTRRIARALSELVGKTAWVEVG